MVRAFAACFATLFSLSLAADVSAQERITLEQAAQQLASRDPAEVRAGIESIGLVGSARGLPLLEARVRKGLSPALLEVALDTLTVLARPEAGSILFELVAHRRAAVRLKAVQAIVACNPPGADRALVSALSDLDAEVRSAAALGIGELRVRGVVGPLFLAFDRNVPEAAVALGQVAQPADITRLLGYLGRVPFPNLTPALTEILGRADVPERSKLEVIGQLQELATGEVKLFLQDFVNGVTDARLARVRRAAEDAITRIAD